MPIQRNLRIRFTRSADARCVVDTSGSFCRSEAGSMDILPSLGVPPTRIGASWFSARGPLVGSPNFQLPRTAFQGGHSVVGEQAGSQDALAGFGMRYAIRSGLLAATAFWIGPITPTSRSFALEDPSQKSPDAQRLLTIFGLGLPPRFPGRNPPIIRRKRARNPGGKTHQEIRSKGVCMGLVHGAKLLQLRLRYPLQVQRCLAG